jgi:hypothetical protein
MKRISLASRRFHLWEKLVLDNVFKKGWTIKLNEIIIILFINELSKLRKSSRKLKRFFLESDFGMNFIF